MRQKGNAAKEVTKKLAEYIPSFKDIFDEETFYICAFCCIICAVVAAVLLSRYIKLKDAGHAD